MKTLTNIRLRPVIRLSPHDFDEVIYPFKTSVSNERIYQYWKEVLSKNGLPNLEPVQKGLSYVYTDTIDDSSLKTLLELNLVDISEYRCGGPTEEEEARDENDITPACFEGGVILTSNDEILVTPQCCIGLQDHREWSNIQLSETFQHIWIGHPWLYYKTKGDEILFTRLIEKTFDGSTWKHYTTDLIDPAKDFSECIDKPQKEILEEDIKYTASFSEMRQTITAMQNELTHFKNRITALAKKMDLKHPAWIAECLVDGNGEMLSYGPEAVA